MSYHLDHRDITNHDQRFRDPRQTQFKNRRINDRNDYGVYISHRNGVSQHSTPASFQDDYDSPQYQSIDTAYEHTQNPYHQTFNRDTTTIKTSKQKRVVGNRNIMDYHIFSPKYEQHQYQSDLMFGGVNNNARENRKQAEIDFNNDYDIKREINEFNETVNNLGIGIDLRRPLATRDQIKDYYKTENKNQQSHPETFKPKQQMASNRYLEKYQFDDSKHLNQYDDKLNPSTKPTFDFNNNDPLNQYKEESWMF